MTRLICLCTLVLLSCASAANDEVFTLKFASFVPASHGMSRWIDDWASTISEQTDGRLVIESLHGGQMGPPPAYYDLAANARADITWVLHGATPGRFKLTEITNMPFLFCSAEQATRVINDQRVREITDPEHRGVQVLTMFMHPPGQINMQGGPVLALEDLQGKAVRPPSRTVGKFIGMTGAKPVGLPPTAMAEGLQKGTINGALIDYGGAGLAFKLGPFLTDITEVYAYTSSFALVMNPDSYQELPDDLQQTLDESLANVSAQIGQVWDALDAKGKAVLIEAGVKIHTLPETEMKKLRGLGDTLTKEYLESLETDAQSAEDLLAVIKAVTQEVGPVGTGCQ